MSRLQAETWTPIPGHEMDAGDLRDEDHRFSVVEIEPGARKTGATLEVGVHLTFDDPETGARTKQN